MESGNVYAKAQAGDSDLLEHLLTDLVRVGIPNAPHGLLRSIAERLWYHEQVPDLALLDEQDRPVAGYVIDRIIRINVVGREQKERVFLAIEPFKPAHPAPSLSTDPLAKIWGATEDLNVRFQELLPYQSRQYAKDYRKTHVTKVR